MKTIKLQFGNYEAFRAAVKQIQSENENKGFLYKLFTQKTELRIPVQRIADIDGDGILYIGQTKNLVNRMLLLFRSFLAAPKKGRLWQHGADEIYWQCEAVRERYPFENMIVEIIPCEDSAIYEQEEISKYYKKFGEVPPFNGAIVKRKQLFPN